MSGERYLLDAETNGLIPEAHVMHIIYLMDLDTHELTKYLDGDLGWQEKLNNCKLVVGHNICGFDLTIFLKLFNYRLPRKVSVHDTMLMSLVLDYRRFDGGSRNAFANGGHSLQAWGEFFDQPKVEHEDWGVYSEEMRIRCESDVLLNVRVYDYLLDEFRQLREANKLIVPYMRAEHYLARWQSEAQLRGWPFDTEAAIELLEELGEKKMFITSKLEARLGIKVVVVDKVKDEVAIKKPKWTKQGCYDAHTASWFNVDPWSGFEGEERVVEGSYSRVKFKPLKLTAPGDVKIFLFRNGWVPTEYNYKFDKETRKKIQMAPKITEDSLELLGGDGALYSDFTTICSRFSILETWLKNVDGNDCIHGDSFTIGTPSMRTRHMTIVNLPTGDAPYGKEMRQLFRGDPGWKLIGCDSAGNQARGLAYYLGNEEFIDVLLNGDIHSYNAEAMTTALAAMNVDHTVKRTESKRVYYAFLFGAGGDKMWSYIFGVLDSKKGNKFKKEFSKAVPGLSELLEKLENIYHSTGKTGYGYIPSLAGNRIYVDSTHKLLVYLLQACEKITCAAALMLTVDKLEEEGIPYRPLIHYHDEEDFMVPEEHAERAKEIGAWAFREGPKLFGIEIMDGAGKIGDNWYDIH